jgi:hypothetical protein
MTENYLLKKDIIKVTKNNIKLVINPSFLIDDNNPDKLNLFKGIIIKNGSFIISDYGNMSSIIETKKLYYATHLDKNILKKKEFKKFNFPKDTEYIYVAYIEEDPMICIKNHINEDETFGQICLELKQISLENI